MSDSQEETTEFTPSALISVSVTGLFGDLDHRVVLSNGSDDISIIHGPNGVGKTTLLRVIDSTFSRNFRSLADLPFQSARFDFHSGSALVVDRKYLTDPVAESTHSLEFHGQLGEIGRSYEYEFDDAQGDIPTGVIEEVVPHLARVGVRSWQDLRLGDTIGLEEALERYIDFFPKSYVQRFRKRALPLWLQQMLSGVTTAYIRAQRLTTYDVSRDRAAARRHGVREEPTVRVYSSEIQAQVSAVLARYAEQSQALDSTFPPRVLNSESGIPDAVALRERYDEQALKRSHYVAAGLLDGTEAFDLPDRDFESGERRMLATWFDDIDIKLAVLEDTAAKLSLLKEIVNSKFRRKALSVSRHEGFVVTDMQGNRLPLTELSSGEQQELVLAHELLFRHKPGTLVLIDEPELSLHVSWQMTFIPDLLKVSRLSDLRFLIATHSPQIIGDRWDLANELSDAAQSLESAS